MGMFMYGPLCRSDADASEQRWCVSATFYKILSQGEKFEQLYFFSALSLPRSSHGTAKICYFVHHVTPEIYLQNGQNGLPRTGNSSGLRCPTDASLGSITLRNDSARTLAMEKWYPLRHPMVKPYPRRPHEIYLYLPYKLVNLDQYR